MDVKALKAQGSPSARWPECWLCTGIRCGGYGERTDRGGTRAHKEHPQARLAATPGLCATRLVSRGARARVRRGLRGHQGLLPGLEEGAPGTPGDGAV